MSYLPRDTNYSDPYPDAELPEQATAQVFRQPTERPTQRVMTAAGWVNRPMRGRMVNAPKPEKAGPTEDELEMKSLVDAKSNVRKIRAGRKAVQDEFLAGEGKDFQFYEQYDLAGARDMGPLDDKDPAQKALHQRYLRQRKELEDYDSTYSQIKQRIGQLTEESFKAPIGITAPGQRQAPIESDPLAEVVDPLAAPEEPAPVEMGSPEWYQNIEKHGGFVGGAKAPAAEGQIYRNPKEAPAPQAGMHRFAEQQKDGSVRVMDVPLEEAGPMVGKSIDDIRAKREKLGVKIGKAKEGSSGRRAYEKRDSDLAAEELAEGGNLGASIISGVSGDPTKFLMGERVQRMNRAGAKPIAIAGVLQQNKLGLEAALKNQNLSEEHREYLKTQLRQNSVVSSQLERQLTDDERKDLNPGLGTRFVDLFQSGASSASSYAYSGIAGITRNMDVGAQWLDNTFFGDSYKQGEGMLPGVARLADELSKDSESFGIGEIAQGRLGNQIAGVVLGQMPVQLAASYISAPAGMVGMYGAMFQEQITDAQKTLGKSFDDMTPEERSSVVKAAVLNGAGGAVMERLGLGVVGSAVLGKSKSMAVQKVVEKLTSGPVWKRIIGSGIIEGETESSQEYLKDKMAQFFYDADRDLWSAEAVQQRLDSFVIGFAAGGMSAPVMDQIGKQMSKQIQNAPPATKEEIATALKEEAVKSVIVGELANETSEAELKKLSPEEFEARVEKKRGEMEIPAEKIAEIEAEVNKVVYGEEASQESQESDAPKKFKVTFKPKDSGDGETQSEVIEAASMEEAVKIAKEQFDHDPDSPMSVDSEAVVDELKIGDQAAKEGAAETDEKVPDAKQESKDDIDPEDEQAPIKDVRWTLKDKAGKTMQVDAPNAQAAIAQAKEQGFEATPDIRSQTIPANEQSKPNTDTKSPAPDDRGTPLGDSASKPAANDAKPTKPVGDSSSDAGAKPKLKPQKPLKDFLGNHTGKKREKYTQIHRSRSLKYAENVLDSGEST